MTAPASSEFGERLRVRRRASPAQALVLRKPRCLSVVGILTLAILAATHAAPSWAAEAHGPNPGVTMIRSGSDWRTLVAPGQTVMIDIGVSNLRGDAPAHNTVLTVLLTAGFTLKQSKPAPDRTENARDGQRLSWNLGTIEAGAFPRLFDLDLQAAPDLKRGATVNVAASLSTTDKVVDPSNTRWALAFSVENPLSYLLVESNLDSVPFTADSPVDFTAALTNLGTVVASACVLRMELPARVAFKSSDPAPSERNGNAVTWQLGEIAPAESRPVKVRVELAPVLRAAAYGFAPKLANLKFKFDATTASNQFNPAPHFEISRHVEPIGSRVEVSLNASGLKHPGELPIGEDVTYHIVYGNFGNARANQVSVSMKLPDGLALASANPPAASSQNDKSGNNVISWAVGDLRAGQSGIISARIHVVSVSSNGSLVAARISAGGQDVSSTEKTAYLTGYAAKK